MKLLLTWIDIVKKKTATAQVYFIFVTLNIYSSIKQKFLKKQKIFNLQDEKYFV